MGHCLLCCHTKTGRGKFGTPSSLGVCTFESSQMRGMFCIDDDCLKELPLVLQDPKEPWLSEQDSDFILTINGKDYKFPNDGRVIRGLPNRIKEILQC